MSSSSSDPDFGAPSITDQKALISANLNSTLLFQFLGGAYIGVYFVTIYIYFSSRGSGAPHKAIIIGTLTVMFGLLLAQILLEWYSTSMTFCTFGDVQLSIFFSSSIGAPVPVVVSILELAVQNLGLVLADGLMLWRCFNACGRSLGIFALPMGLFFVEFSLIMTNTVYTSIFYAKTSFQTVQTARIANIISGATFVAVTITSITVTYLICHHIYTSTNHNKRSWVRYKHIVDICIQSSILYTTMMIFETIVDFLETDDPLSAANISVQALDMYLESFLNVASALAPTLMVARLAIATESNTIVENSSVHLPSELECAHLPINDAELRTDSNGLPDRHAVEKDIEEVEGGLDGNTTLGDAEDNKV